MLPIKAQEGNQEVNACLVNNTGCPAKLKFTVSGSTLHTSNRYKLSITRKCKKDSPLEIILDFDHNHSNNSADALRYRPVSENCKIIFIELFSEDYTPKNIEDIRISGTDDFTHLMADRNAVPGYFGVFHFHAQFMEKRFGTINGVDAYQKVK